MLTHVFITREILALMGAKYFLYLRSMKDLSQGKHIFLLHLDYTKSHYLGP